jgi:hypothetical protein
MECLVLRCRASRHGFTASFSRTVEQSEVVAIGQCQAIVWNQTLNCCPWNCKWMQTFSSVCTYALARAVFPSLFTPCSTLCRLQVNDSLFVVSRNTFSTRFLNTEIKQSPSSAFYIKCRSVGLFELHLQKMALGFRNKHLHTAVPTCEETVLSISKTVLIFSFCEKICTSFWIGHWYLQQSCY